VIAQWLLGTLLVLGLAAIVCAAEGRARRHDGLVRLAIVLGAMAFWAGVGTVLCTWAGW
jgi:hypothetical protein